MKTYSLILLFFCFGVCRGQTNDSTMYYGNSDGNKDSFVVHKCDSGYSYMPSIGTSSLRIVADTCLPDSTYKKLWREYEENMCGETGMAWMELSGKDGSLSYSSGNHWDEEKGCIYTPEWHVMISGEWIQITEDQYNKIEIARKNKLKTHSNKKHKR